MLPQKALETVLCGKRIESRDEALSSAICVVEVSIVVEPQKSGFQEELCPLQEGSNSTKCHIFLVSIQTLET